MASKHIAHTRRRDADTELLQLTHDAEIAPARVLPRETKDQCDGLILERIRRDSLATRIGPVATNKFTVPTQQRRWCDEEGGPTLAREKPSQCRDRLGRTAAELPGDEG